MNWLKSLFCKPPRAEVLHRWIGYNVQCLCCGSKDKKGHLRPTTRLLGIQDVAAAYDSRWRGKGYDTYYTAGLLIDIVASVCWVDPSALVYTAEGHPGDVFVELSDSALLEAVRTKAEDYKPLGVRLVFVGAE